MKEAQQLSAYAVTRPDLIEDVSPEEWRSAVACARAVVLWARATVGSTQL